MTKEIFKLDNVFLALRLGQGPMGVSAEGILSQGLVEVQDFPAILPSLICFGTVIFVSNDNKVKNLTLDFRNETGASVAKENMRILPSQGNMFRCILSKQALSIEKSGKYKLFLKEENKNEIVLAEWDFQPAQQDKTLGILNSPDFQKGMQEVMKKYMQDFLSKYQKIEK